MLKCQLKYLLENAYMVIYLGIRKISYYLNHNFGCRVKQVEQLRGV
jgi:hypothetical protein